MCRLRWRSLRPCWKMSGEPLSGADAFRASLREHGQLIIAPVGQSMLPLLRPSRDTVVLEPPCFPLRRFDVALYERPDGLMVLHRVLRAAGDEYVLRGDNQAESETVRREQICAVMTGFFQGERYFFVRSPWYRAYCRLWCGACAPRRLIAWGMDRCRALRQRLR